MRYVFFVRIVGYRYMSPKHDPTAAAEAQGAGICEKERTHTHTSTYIYTCKIQIQIQIPPFLQVRLSICLSALI